MIIIFFYKIQDGGLLRQRSIKLQLRLQTNLIWGTPVIGGSVWGLWLLDWLGAAVPGGTFQQDTGNAALGAEGWPSGKRRKIHILLEINNCYTFSRSDNGKLFLHVMWKTLTIGHVWVRLVPGATELIRFYVWVSVNSTQRWRRMRNKQRIPETQKPTFSKLDGDFSPHIEASCITTWETFELHRHCS